LDVEATVIDGIDVGTVHKTAKEVVRRVRAGEGPLFVEARTYLWPGNAFNLPKLVGGLTDIAWAWDAGKAPEKVRDWHRDADPILKYIRELESAGVSRNEIEQLDIEVQNEVDAAARFALESPLPEAKAALNYAFAGIGH
jgi:pyruvate dehydrogenase E1 component alpha subunit